VLEQAAFVNCCKIVGLDCKIRQRVVDSLSPIRCAANRASATPRLPNQREIRLLSEAGRGVALGADLPHSEWEETNRPRA